MAVIMDFAGIIGLVMGFGLMVFGIIDGGGNIAKDFVDVPSLAITIGGTFAATICSFPLGVYKAIPKHFKIAFGKSKYNPKQYIETIVEYAVDARKKGILSLEDKVNEQQDEFMKKSVMLVVDAIEPEKTKRILENELDCLESRHQQGFKIYEKASSFAPAFGMIGTLIGLVNMLANLDLNSDEGSKALTSGMATALITTLYGSILANLLLSPFANKLRYRHAEEMLCKEIIVEGVIAIQAGDNPKHIEERLNSFLEPSMRGSSDGSGSMSSNDDEQSTGKKGKKKK